MLYWFQDTHPLSAVFFIQTSVLIDILLQKCRGADRRAQQFKLLEGSIVSLYYSALQHYSTTALQHYSTTALQHYSTHTHTHTHTHTNR